MTVSELVDALLKLDPNLEVKYFWDGAARSKVDQVYEAKGGFVLLSEKEDMEHNYGPMYEEDKPK